MQKIAMTSDNHFDVNQVAVAQTMQQQVAYLLANHYTDYLIAGDLFNGFSESVAFVEEMAWRLAPTCRLFFIAGNHDMVHGADFATLQGSVDSYYAHQKMIDFPDTDYVLIGNNGWYDYRFAQVQGKTTADFLKWKKTYWIDGRIDQPLSDQRRMALVLTNTKILLRRAQVQHKKVLYMTHFVPQEFYITHVPQVSHWEMANGMMGSPQLATLLDRSQVDYVLFGHTHTKYPPRQINGTTYFCQPVGYGRQPHAEWKFGTNFISEWQACLQTLILK
ncbi:metallophosphoesterase [Loigolactobacillus coryniformis]|uniref:metallophosphoesterase n=1 Tax=Loigolactobacillus coryniformis TaxID=1610 RepID=UPI001C5DF308|nr:metallophosphoesterase [Loigolactobacillus coryniformis]MBW4801542.1 metallophosphoesterase [Loigolactobacillus coryniformis subsp. torquens]MBW4804243.1 metallophosphoesterase [Loigolactobacillus coryniformis subsp. torquens]